MNITKTELLEALANLDPAVEANWTAEGLPSVEALANATLDDTLAREDLTENALGFDRETAVAAVGAKSEIAADDQSKADAAGTVEQASEKAKESVDQLLGASGVDGTKFFDPAERRAQLQAAVASAVDDLGELDLALSRQRQMRDRMVAAVDAAKKALEAEFPPLKHADIVRQWLDSEAEKRQARSEVGLQSPTDQRFQRRTGYGGGRPNIPPVQTHAR